jgi:hypothetical protein
MVRVTPELSHANGRRHGLRSRRYCSGLADPIPRFQRTGVELVIIHGRANQLVRRVRVPVFLIGSHRECDLVLGDARFPAVHSYLYVTRQGVRLRHLGAPPAVRVDGRVVDVAMLVTGNVIDLAPFQFQIRIHD